MPFDQDAFQLALQAGRAAFQRGQEAGTQRPATSGRHVAPIHRFVAEELVRHGFPASATVPDVTDPDGKYLPETAQRLLGDLRRLRAFRTDDARTALDGVEQRVRRTRRSVLGAYHAKEVDVSVMPEGMGPLVVVSIKAPTSSVAKNVVNRYEEGIGEATNLHTRFPMLVFGFLMVLPKVPELYDNGQPTQAFRRVEILLEATSGRQAVTDPPGGYEAAALVLVNYDMDPPTILEGAPAAGSRLRIEQFFDSLTALHRDRNGDTFGY